MIDTIKFKQEEVYDRLKADILAGRLKESVQLPKEVDFAKSLGVARGTLRNVLDMLENDGLIVRLRSKGTFVKPRNQGTETRKILILLDINQQNDISWPSNYIIPGLESETKNLGMKTEICPLQLINEMSIDVGMKFLNNADIHGVMIFGGRFTGSENYIQILQRLEKPVVIAGGVFGDSKITGFALVRTDLRGARTDAVRHLKIKGHRRIATLGYYPLQGYVNDMEAYKVFLVHEGLYHPDFIKFAEYNYNSIKESFISLMQMEYAPTAIMCYSDFYAIHILRAAKEIGIKVPNELAVMGYCGFPGGAYLDPPLSTVDFHYFKIGETVARIFDKAHEWFGVEGVSAPDIIFPYEIVERESTLIKRMEGAFV